jgi:hypothetical protein
MTLDEIQRLWEEDSNINPDNLHLESLKIPQLHAKYYKIYNNIVLLKKKSVEDYSKLKKERYEYYSGKSSQEVYSEEPFPFKVRDKESMNRYLDSDEKLSNIRLKNEYYDSVLKYLEDIIKTIHNRSFQIKNAIDWQRFQAGYE